VKVDCSQGILDRARLWNTDHLRKFLRAILQRPEGRNHVLDAEFYLVNEDAQWSGRPNLFFRKHDDNGINDNHRIAHSFDLVDGTVFVNAVNTTGLDPTNQWTNAVAYQDSEDALLALALAYLPNLRALVIELPKSRQFLTLVVDAAVNGRDTMLQRFENLTTLDIGQAAFGVDIQSSMTTVPFHSIQSLDSMVCNYIMPAFNPDTPLNRLTRIELMGWASDFPALCDLPRRAIVCGAQSQNI